MAGCSGIHCSLPIQFYDYAGNAILTSSLEKCRLALATQNWAELRKLGYTAVLEAARSPEANYYCGLACFHCFELAKAEEHLCRAIYLAPAHPAAYVALVQLLVFDKRPELAKEILDRALSNCPAHADWLIPLAETVVVFSPELALSLAEKSLGNDPANPAAACKKLELLLVTTDEIACQQFVESYARHFPKHPNSQVLLAMHSEYHGNLAKAYEIYASLLEKYPHDSGIRFNLARLLESLGRIDDLQKTLAPHRARTGEHPASEILLAHSLFSTANFQDAFFLYENRDKIGWRPIAPIPHAMKWEGESLTGKSILMVYEQGYGDMLLGSRYIPLLAERAFSEGALRVGMLCHSQLYSYFVHTESCTDIDLCFEVPPAGIYDYYIPILSIHDRLKLGDELPHMAPNDFKAPSRLVKKWTERLGQSARPQVGVVWKSVSTARNAAEKSLPDELLSKLIEHCPKMDWIAFAPGTSSPERHQIRDVSNYVDDFADTATLMRCMDAVISIDTGPAHLAGCLGIPQILLSQHRVDWRWITKPASNESVWHPETHVVKQAVKDDWESIIRPTANLLQDLVFSNR